ncbi:MAG: response regulator [Deltaproteobacteria bacterium]|nr:response regulator [Deltaproteobacteria bacterium]
MALKVLTVDDSKTIRMIVKKAFQPFDCQIFEAENGVEGLSAASREKPDLIVLDITMPIMNGVEMLERLKGDGFLKNIPVIMLTAESGKDNVMRIVKMGIKDYVVKPFKGEQLIERATKLVTLAPKKAGDGSEEASKKYFTVDEEFQVLVLPEKITRQVAVEVENCLEANFEQLVRSGMNKVIVDMRQVKEISVSLIKLMMLIIKSCQKVNLRNRIVGTPTLCNELKEFKETSDIPVDASLEEAKAGF